MTHEPTRLVLDGVSCERGGVTVLRKVSLRLDPGGCALVRGSNGSGKSTLLRVAAGLLPTAEGSVELAPAEAGVHYVGHALALKPELTLRTQLETFGGACEGALERMGLGFAIDLPARVLSAGQKKRAALARLLMDSKALWLLDEPTASLDADGSKIVMQLVDLHCEMGGMAMIATHDPIDLRTRCSVLELQRP